MNAPKRDLVSIEDLSNAEILALFRLADEFRTDLRAWPNLCQGSILAALFFEPSTRTRLSFESAMQRLGGSVITVPEGASSSQAKGESLADMVRVVGGSYADLIVIRHPDDGAARVAARYAKVPVINGGDGAHEHPTQTLCDLYTLWQEKGRLEGLDVVLCGDLLYSRTIHSFAVALARFSANILTVPYPGLEMPDDVLRQLRDRFGLQAQSVAVDELAGIASQGNTAAYLTASKPHQLALFTSLDQVKVQHIDAIYMTRAQRERHGHAQAGGPYQRLSEASLRGQSTRDTKVMHPLPRTDEIAYEFDDDPRAVYFRQAELGVPIRMALMAFLLGKRDLGVPPAGSGPEVIVLEPPGVVCPNEGCISNREGRRYLPREFTRARDSETLSCAFCGRLATGMSGG